MDAIIEEYSPLSVFSAVIGVISLLIGLRLVQQPGTAAVVAYAATFAAAVVVIAYQAASLGAAKRLVRQRERTIRWFTIRLYPEDVPSVYEILEWDETITVKKGGDTGIEHWLTLRAVADGFAFYRVLITPTYDDTIQSGIRDKIRVVARSFSSGDDSRSRETGAVYDTTAVWRGSTLVLYVHLGDVREVGETVCLWLSFSWPRYNRELLEGSPDAFEWHARRGIGSLTTVVKFDKSCGVNRPFHLGPYRGSPKPRQVRTGEGATEISLAATDVPPNVKVGYHIDLG